MRKRIIVAYECGNTVKMYLSRMDGDNTPVFSKHKADAMDLPDVRSAEAAISIIRNHIGVTDVEYEMIITYTP